MAKSQYLRITQRVYNNDEWGWSECCIQWVKNNRILHFTVFESFHSWFSISLPCLLVTPTALKNGGIIVFSWIILVFFIRWIIILQEYTKIKSKQVFWYVFIPFIHAKAWCCLPVPLEVFPGIRFINHIINTIVLLHLEQFWIWNSNRTLTTFSSIRIISSTHFPWYNPQMYHSSLNSSSMITYSVRHTDSSSDINRHHLSVHMIRIRLQFDST